MAAGSHPFPFRTRKLSPPAPMVLGGRLPGRVGRRRISLARAPCACAGGSLRFLPSSRPLAARHRGRPLLVRCVPWPKNQTVQLLGQAVPLRPRAGVGRVHLDATRDRPAGPGAIGARARAGVAADVRRRVRATVGEPPLAGARRVPGPGQRPLDQRFARSLNRGPRWAGG